MDGQNVGPNWAEMAVAILTGFGLFGGAFMTYLNGKVRDNREAVNKEVKTQRAQIDTKIEQQRREIEAQMVKHRSEMEETASAERGRLFEKVTAESRAVGDSLNAIRTHVSQVELWIRDNRVGKEEFKTTIDQMNRNFETLRDGVQHSVGETNAKIDRLRDTITDKLDELFPRQQGKS